MKQTPPGQDLSFGRCLKCRIIQWLILSLLACRQQNNSQLTGRNVNLPINFFCVQLWPSAILNLWSPKREFLSWFCKFLHLAAPLIETINHLKLSNVVDYIPFLKKFNSHKGSINGNYYWTLVVKQRRQSCIIIVTATTEIILRCHTQLPVSGTINIRALFSNCFKKNCDYSFFHGCLNFKSEIL